MWGALYHARRWNNDQKWFIIYSLDSSFDIKSPTCRSTISTDAPIHITIKSNYVEIIPLNNAIELITDSVRIIHNACPSCRVIYSSSYFFFFFFLSLHLQAAFTRQWKPHRWTSEIPSVTSDLWRSKSRCFLRRGKCLNYSHLKLIA